MENEIVTNNCKNCSKVFSGKFCSECGQKIFSESDMSFKNIFLEIFHFATHFEGTFFTSIKTIFLYPSKMTLDYCSGVRKKYFKPVSLFLFVVVVYLLFPLAKGLNMDMKDYKGNLIGRSFISLQIEEKASKLNISEQELSNKFRVKSEKVSKFFLFLLIPLTVLALFLIFPNKKLKAYELTILSTEINIFYIAVYFLIIPLITYLLSLILKPTHLNLESNFFISLFLFSFGLYIFFVFKNYFKLKWHFNILKSALFVFSYFLVIIIIYRFLVFETTLLLV